MQDVIGTIGKVTTSAGTETLRMSIGVHSGQFHFFLVGDSHRELIVTGPAVTETVEMETIADATEIVVSPATARALPATCITAPKGHGFLIGAAVPDVESGPVDTSPAVGDLEGYVPLAVRERITAGVTEPEHRQVTIAFIHFGGVDGLLATGGPNAVGAALSDLVGRVQAAIDPRGVAFLATDVYDDGGKIILTAGAPTATGNDSERMLLALREIVGRDSGLPIRIGVNRGHVFAGDVGPSYRRTYTVMGDDVNLAARLMSAASPGEIYATPAVLDRSRTLFVTTPLEPFSVKGKVEKVEAFVVGEEAGIRSPRTRDDLPFTGRRDELALLTNALDQARLGSGAAVTVTGDRGIGKSRLVREAAAGVPDVPVITIRAESMGTASPFRPFRDPFRALLGVERGNQRDMARRLRESVGSLDPDLLPFLPLIADVAHVTVDPTPEVEALDPQFRRERLADIVIQLVGLVHPGPLLLAFENSHWMDDASAALTNHLLQAASDRPWLAVATRIDTDDDAGSEAVITLGPLDSKDAAAIVVAATVDHPLRPHDVRAIVLRAAGNPLFLEELLSAVTHTGTAADLPDSLDALVNAQIDALPQASRRLLRYASVLGSSFRQVLLDQLLREDDLELDPVVMDSLADFLAPEGVGRIRFRHGVLRDVVYEGLAYRRRRHLHARAAHAIERLAGEDVEANADLLSFHYSLALEFEPTWRFARVAGDRARESYANVDAAVHYERALGAANRLKGIGSKHVGAVWESLGDVREQAGLFRESLDAFRRASRLMGEDLAARTELLLKRALARMRSGAYSEALRETARGLRLADQMKGHDARLAQARLMAFRASIRAAQQRPRETLEVGLPALEMARAVSDDESLARVYSALDWAHLVLGRFDEAVFGSQALEIYERLGNLDAAANIMNNLGAMAYYEGAWDEAVDWYAKAQEAFGQAGNEAGAANTGANIGEVLVSQNRLDEAEPVIRDAARVLRATDNDQAPFAEIQLARLLIERGDHAGARSLLERLHGEATGLGQPVSALEALLHLARLAVLGGEPHAALSLLELGEKAAGGDAVVFAAAVARERASALGALGRFEEAFAVLVEGLAEARDQGLPYEEALLLHLQVELAPRSGSDPDPDLQREAEALDERLGIRR